MNDQEISNVPLWVIKSIFLKINDAVTKYQMCELAKLDIENEFYWRNQSDDKVYPVHSYLLDRYPEYKKHVVLYKPYYESNCPEVNDILDKMAKMPVGHFIAMDIEYVLMLSMNLPFAYNITKTKKDCASSFSEFLINSFKINNTYMRFDYYIDNMFQTIKIIKKDNLDGIGVFDIQEDLKSFKINVKDNILGDRLFGDDIEEENVEYETTGNPKLDALLRSHKELRYNNE